MKQRAGLLLTVVLLLLTAGIQYGRVALFMEEEPPAVSIGVSDTIWVELGEGFPEQGIHQFIDGSTPRSVIQVTLGVENPDQCERESLDRPLVSGEVLCLHLEDTEIIELERRWMAAARRMTLGIPLRPRAMSSDDWAALPGIGPKLAAAIELDRQKNGEFSSFSELRRVPGIGSGKLAALEKYFYK